MKRLVRQPKRHVIHPSLIGAVLRIDEAGAAANQKDAKHLELLRDTTGDR